MAAHHTSIRYQYRSKETNPYIPVSYHLHCHARESHLAKLFNVICWVVRGNTGQSSHLNALVVALPIQLSPIHWKVACDDLYRISDRYKINSTLSCTIQDDSIVPSERAPTCATSVLFGFLLLSCAIPASCCSARS
jgi:hypothetical protein